MNDHALGVLEFDKVREIVARFAATEPGRERVLRMLPAADRAAAATRLSEAAELISLLHAGEHPPFDGARPVGPVLETLAAPGAMLQPAELLAVASTLAAARRVQAFFRRFAERAGGGSRPAVPLLCAKAASIVPLAHLEEAVAAALDETGNVRDSASPELRRVRKLIARTRDEILDRVGRILRDAEARNIAQEQVVTVRDDRYVIPLKPNFRQGVPGVVRGHSGSRATVFVEPLEVLEQNNRLAELRMDERAEIERILRELTALLAKDAADIATDLEALTALDEAAARARFGNECGGTIPALSAEGTLRLRAARHPLLVWKRRTASGSPDVVPNDIALAGERRSLIISGPNAGGKTVILKTIGLLCLLAQAGVPVTAAAGSEVPVFSEVYADIGDEQNIEQDLSTFSSHIARIAEILRQADRGALVLLDELGSGTDPSEGAALGAAVLARLLESGCLTVVTTHHGGLKLFGSRTDGAVNAAMEFDPQTLKPTYRFVPGRPGRSYGLDMAERLGVPDDVIRGARSRLTSQEAGLDRLLERIEQDSRALRQEREQAEADRRAAERLRIEADERARTAVEEARNARNEAKREAREVLAALRRKLKDLSGAAALSSGELKTERQEVDAQARRLEHAEPEPGLHPAAVHEFHAGDRVMLTRLNRTGTVLFVHRDELEVEAGGVKLRLPAREAAPMSDAREQPSPAALGWSADLEEREGAPDRVNLLGMRVDEALTTVERFIDRAGYLGFHRVVVIHGLGTGALKAAVTGCLKGHALVASLRAGEPAEGGAGVTVVELKK